MPCFLTIILLLSCYSMLAQDQTDSARTETTQQPNADDPSQFITRIEVYNELQYRKENDFYINQAIFRTIVKLGRRFTTRLDVPYVSNTIQSPAGYQSNGLGDISLRLLGYQLYQRPRSALTASVELSFNTAASPLLGTGKNLVIPMMTYTLLYPKQKLLLSAAYQYVDAFSGDEERIDVKFSKLQFYVLKYWAKKYWTVLSPELFYDHVKDDVSMNIRLRVTHAPTPKMNIWITPSAGIFGDFFPRYTWSVDFGGRYFLFRKVNRAAN